MGVVTCCWPTCGSYGINLEDLSLQVQCIRLQPGVVHEVEEGNVRALRMRKSLQLISGACHSLLEAMHASQPAEFLQDVHVAMIALENAGRRPSRRR